MMSDGTTEILLQTHDGAKVLRLLETEKFSDGSGYGSTLVVRSGGFMCERPFYFDDAHLRTAIRALRQMEAGHIGEATLKGSWEPDFVKLANNGHGHVFVSGAVYEHSDTPQSLTFEFRTDQTVIGPFVQDLLRLREE